MANGLRPIDWTAPWLLPYAERGRALWSHLERGASVAGALNSVASMGAKAGMSAGQIAASGSVRFVDHQELPTDQAYEAFVFETKTIPTRNNVHDALNGLSWLHFPQTKQRLNELQADQIDRLGVLPTRGKVRDALTVFDENAAFLQAPNTLWEALAAKEWPVLFDDLREQWRDARVVLFGHALLEKLADPRPAITAHVYRVEPSSHSLTDWDQFVASDLSLDKLASKPFAHLPVLGIPGWWPANQDPTFYQDTTVFRPLRRAN